MNSVRSCDTQRPPTTATPRGWRSSAPAPAPIAIGSVPKIAAKVVIMMGRKRSSAASRMACSALKPTRRRSSAKSTIMMAFFLTMPTSITMPIIAITDSSTLNSISVRMAPMPAQGIQEHLRRAGEAGGDGGRQIRALLDRGDLVHRIAKRIVRREVEGDRHRGLLPLMVDLQRADGRYKFRNRVERDGLVVRGLQVELGQI